MNEWNSGQQWCRGDRETERRRRRRKKRVRVGEVKTWKGRLYCDRQKHRRPRLKTSRGSETEKERSTK